MKKFANKNKGAIFENKLKQTNDMEKNKCPKRIEGAVLMDDYWVFSIWDEYDERDEDDIKASSLYSKSIIEYIKMFNQLPHKGMKIDNSYTDTTEIQEIYFNGVEKEIHISLTFE